MVLDGLGVVSNLLGGSLFDINGKLSNRPGERQVSVQHPPGNERIEKLQNSRLLQIHLPQSRYVPEHCRTPLLSATEDYLQVIRILAEELGQETAADTALVLMGHGSGHFANSAYAAMDYMFKEQGFPHIFVGTVEAYPDVNTVLKQLAKTGCTKVLLTPLMVVAGDHATNDMAGDEDDSWKTIFQQAGYEVSILLKGLGEYPAIRRMYVEHIRRAMELQPV